MTEDQKKAGIFSSIGAVAGGLTYAVIGGAGLAAMGGAVAITAPAMIATGAVVGLAAFGAKKALGDKGETK